MGEMGDQGDGKMERDLALECRLGFNREIATWESEQIRTGLLGTRR